MAHHRLDLVVVQAYLVPCTGGFLLIDTGYHQQYDRLRNELKRVGVTLSEIKYLLLTHHHDDHTGLAARLVEETGATVIAHQRAAQPLARGENEDRCSPLPAGRWAWSLFRLFHPEFKYPPLRLDHRALLVAGDDDELLRGLGVDGAILHTPGHTGDSISVLLDDGTCFAGDAAMNIPFFRGIKYRPIYLESLDQVYSSWTKLLSRGAKTLYPGHGTPFPSHRLTPL